MTLARDLIANPFADALDGLGALQRPRRVPVSVGAAESLVLNDGGGFSGKWSADPVPYLVKPMDTLASRHKSAVCFVGPARTGKTAGLILGWIAHTVTNDIGRMMVMHMTEKKAAMLSKLDVEPAIDASENLRALKSPRAHDNNIGLKVFRHGMAIRFSHPSRSELAGTTYRYVALTDFDRFPTGGMGGNLFDSAMKRTETLMSRGMTLVESSPERKIDDPHWRPSTPHEAPPCGGILGIYNRSDLQRWYWPCPDCGEYFEAAPGLSLFGTLPPEKDLIEIVRKEDLVEMAERHAHIVCPHCAVVIGHEKKFSMNARGAWVGDRQTIKPSGEIVGPELGSNIAGFWLGGVAAAYQTWRSLLLKYLQGIKEYALSGDEDSLEASSYVDQAMPYIPRHLLAESESSVEDRKEDLPQHFVPAEARFLAATADVQGGTNGRFVCEVRAFGPHLESWLVDRFSITTTTRNGVAAQVDPSGYPEDWDLLTDRLVTATWRLHDGREMRVFRTAVDSGGESGTAQNAYAWFRRIRNAGHAARVMLIKGGSHAQEKPTVKGSARRNDGKPMRDMPLWIINTDYYKDIVAASLRRKAPGPGYFHPPAWLPQSYFDELKAEVRDKAGKWKKIKARNEALDLWVYSLAICEALGFGAKGRLSWDDPPGWALPQSDANTEIITREERKAEHAKEKPNPLAQRRPGRPNFAKNW